MEKSFMNQLKRGLVLFFAVLCVSALTSVLSHAADASEQTSAPKEGASEYVKDSWITTKVKAALVEDKLVRATEVNVETVKGVVQLSGFVSSEAAVNHANSVTQGIKGVTSVENKIRVK